MWVQIVHCFIFDVFLHGGVNVVIAQLSHCLHIKHFIWLLLLLEVICYNPLAAMLDKYLCTHFYSSLN